jgi:hypothetical protein
MNKAQVQKGIYDRNLFNKGIQSLCHLIGIFFAPGSKSAYALGWHLAALP